MRLRPGACRIGSIESGKWALTNLAALIKRRRRSFDHPHGNHDRCGATAATLDPALKQAAQNSTDAAHQATADASSADATITSYCAVTKQYA
jgi:hypothetical protein